MKKKWVGEIERETEGERGGYARPVEAAPQQQIKRKTLPMSSQTEKSASSKLVWRAQEVSV